MTNAEFINSRCESNINGAYILIKDMAENPQTASNQRGMFIFENGWGRGFGWCSFKNTPFIDCVELPYQVQGVQVYGLLMK